MKIALCEDNQIQLELLKQMVTKWSIERKKFIDLKYYLSAEAFLFAMPEEKPFDILLLDIQMKEVSGIELAKKLRKMKNEVIIIFVTALKEYVFEGYNVNALHYLMKPVDEKVLFEVLDRATVKLNRQEKYLIINNKKICQKDICYIEAQSHYIHIYTMDDTLKIKSSLHQILQKIDEHSFALCHRSYIVNLNAISKILKEEIVLEDKRKIPISRLRYNDINKAFIDFYTR